MKACPVCRYTPLNREARFCYADGAELIERPLCKCGGVLCSADKFCEMCGKAVEEIREQANERMREQEYDLRSNT